jgi:hypothetical protein
MWTEAQIVELLNTNDRAVERAIIVLHQRQTLDEQVERQTKHTNHIGFRQNHAPRLSYYARLLRMGNHLYPSQLSVARKWVVMYRKQLTEIANAKEIDRQEDAREHLKASFAGNE